MIKPIGRIVSDGGRSPRSPLRELRCIQILERLQSNPSDPCGPAPLKGSLCYKEAQAYDTHRTLILESLDIQAVEGVDYRLGSVCTQIQAIFLLPEEAPLKGSWPVGPEGFKTQEYESALPTYPVPSAGCLFQRRYANANGKRAKGGSDSKSPKVLSEKLRYGGFRGRFGSKFELTFVWGDL